MNLDKIDIVAKILNKYRTFLKKNYKLFYENKNYFYEITKEINQLSPKLKYLNRKVLKSILSKITKDTSRNLINKYFYDSYGINVKDIKFSEVKNHNITNSRCYYKNGIKKIEITIYNNIQDCFIISHEFRHYLNMKETNSIVYDYLTESLSIFEELNLYYYLKKYNIISGKELDLVNKMTFIKHSMISEKNMIFFRLDKVIDENGVLKTKQDIYTNLNDIQKDIYLFLEDYNQIGLQYHITALYNLGILIACSIMQNIKNKNITLDDFQILNNKISESNDFNILHLVNIDINDLNTIFEYYKKELEEFF